MDSFGVAEFESFAQLCPVLSVVIIGAGRPGGCESSHWLQFSRSTSARPYSMGTYPDGHFDFHTCSATVHSVWRLAFQANA
jgi:hypothetical protein